MTAIDDKTVSKKIKEDYGTVAFFCKKHDINIHTFRQVIYGYGTSTKIVNLLIKHKYIKDANELKKAA